jgi:hypothetical protein
MEEALKDLVGQIDSASVLIVLVMGVIGERVFAMLHPVEEKPIKDRLYETAFAGLASAVFAFPLLFLLSQATAVGASYYWAFVAIVAATPAILTIVVVFLWRVLVRVGWVLGPHPTPWDDLFIRKPTLWVIVHMKDGRRIGGIYASASRASLNPKPGHLYLEELWNLDANGGFVNKVPYSKGALFRPEDYSLVEFF